jgi:hypothetical protein
MEAVRKLVEQLILEGVERLDEDKRDTTKFGFKDVPMGIVLEFLGKLDVSPKNEQFNLSSIVKFIKGYRGKELKKWDIAFATGKSTVPVDFGHGIRYNYPLRSFSVVNDGKILKMSGVNRRIGAASDGQFGLNEGILEKIKKEAKERGIENPSQKDYFRNVDRNPLLTIYVVELKNLKDEAMLSEELKKSLRAYEGKTVVGFGVGIPSLSDQETKYARYILNKIAIQQIFEGDVDWDAEEEDD